MILCRQGRRAATLNLSAILASYREEKQRVATREADQLSKGSGILIPQ
jgi:hypothetical protein